MPITRFDRDATACWYAHEHLKTDPGIVEIHYLPHGADEREIRFVEVNKLLGRRTDDILEPIDFGVDPGTENAHRLLVLDVTPDQWKRIRAGMLPLPGTWSLEDSRQLPDE